MKEIWKFPIGPGMDSFQMPVGAVVLAVQVQREQPCIWVVVDPAAPKQPRSFFTVGTGHQFDSRGFEYLGTFQLQDGALVFHTFEVVNG